MKLEFADPGTFSYWIQGHFAGCVHPTAREEALAKSAWEAGRRGVLATNDELVRQNATLHLLANQREIELAEEKRAHEVAVETTVIHWRAETDELSALLRSCVEKLEEAVALLRSRPPGAVNPAWFDNATAIRDEVRARLEDSPLQSFPTSEEKR